MKKQRTSLFRILILSLVMLVTLFIIGVAWFVTKPEAVASGLSIRSSYGPGLDAAFDDLNYATYIKRDSTFNFQFPLISGTGQRLTDSNGDYLTDTAGNYIDNFFIPSLDRATGTPLDATSGLPTSGTTNWASKRQADAAHYGDTTGDYYVEDIYFRSDKQLDVYLTDKSTVLPADETKRKSQFGDFSTDNIAGAARVGFFRVDTETTGEGESKVTTETETPLFTWIPNQTYQLTNAGDFEPIMSTGSSSGTGTFNPNDPDQTFGLSDNPDYTATDMYLWEVKWDRSTSKSEKTRYQMYKDSNGNYYAAITVSAGTYVDHGVKITSDSSTTIPTGSFSATCGKANTNLFTHQDPTDTNTPFIEAYFSGNDFSAGSDDRLCQLVVNFSDNSTAGDFFTTNDKFQILVQYNVNGLKKSDGTDANCQIRPIGFVFYNNAQNQAIQPGQNYIYNGYAGIHPAEGGEFEYYSMVDGSTVVITNNETTVDPLTNEGEAYALNAVSVATNTLPIKIKKTTKTISLEGGGTETKEITAPVTPLNSQLFKVTANATQTAYKLQSLSNKYYLAISDGMIVLQKEDPGLNFTLEVGDKGPRLKSDNSYIAFSNDKFTVSNTTANTTLQIYQGTGYGFEKKGTIEDKYVCYDSSLSSPGLNQLTHDVDLGSPYSPLRYVFTSDFFKSENKVVTLQPVNEGTSYKAHIRIKIWAEGTDREAKIPLAGGIFTTHLEFLGVTQGETPTEPSTTATTQKSTT